MSSGEKIHEHIRLSQPDGELIVTTNHVHWRQSAGERSWPIATLTGARVSRDEGRTALVLLPRVGAAERVVGFRSPADAERAELGIISRLWRASAIGRLIAPLPEPARHALSTLLESGERIFVTVVGDGAQTMVATDRRLILIKPRPLGHPVIGSYSYSQVDRVDFCSPSPRVAGSIVVATANAPAPPATIGARRWAPNILTFSDGGQIPMAARRMQELVAIGRERAGLKTQRRATGGSTAPHLLLAVAEQLQQIDERRARGDLAPDAAEVAVANVTVPFTFGMDIGLAPAGEHDTADVLLIFAGRNRRKTARILNQATGLPRHACKTLVCTAPTVVRHAVPIAAADRMRDQLQQVGAQVEILPRLSPGG
jgi:ribosomal protein L7/L12